MINNIVSTSKREHLKNVSLSASTNTQTIDIENYNKYKALYIVFRAGGDNNNGLTMYVPKACYDIANTFTVNVANSFGTSFTCKSQGYFKDGQISIKILQLAGWTSMIVTVYGIN